MLELRAGDPSSGRIPQRNDYLHPSSRGIIVERVFIGFNPNVDLAGFMNASADRKS
jgi:hypothetical protein